MDTKIQQPYSTGHDTPPASRPTVPLGGSTMEYNAFDTQACVCVENKQMNKDFVKGLIWNSSKSSSMSTGFH